MNCLTKLTCIFEFPWWNFVFNNTFLIFFFWNISNSGFFYSFHRSVDFLSTFPGASLIQPLSRTSAPWRFVCPVTLSRFQLYLCHSCVRHFIPLHTAYWCVRCTTVVLRGRKHAPCLYYTIVSSTVLWAERRLQSCSVHVCGIAQSFQFRWGQSSDDQGHCKSWCNHIILKTC